jgi:hypothetical protein
MKSLRLSHYLPLMLQGLLVVVVLGVVALMPPRTGAILIVSMNGQSENEIARWAIAHDARLISRGPFAHSLVVSGDRAALFDASLGERAVLLSGPAAGCGEQTIA